MRKVYMLLLGVSILLIVWGAVDFFNYFTIGTELLTIYDDVDRYDDVDSVTRLVNNALIGGIIKIGLGAILAGVALFTMKRAK